MSFGIFFQVMARSLVRKEVFERVARLGRFLDWILGHSVFGQSCMRILIITLRLGLSHPVGEPIVCLGWAAALELWFRLSSLVGKPIGRLGRATALVWHPSRFELQALWLESPLSALVD